jgi:serine protease AprX
MIHPRRGATKSRRSRSLTNHILALALLAYGSAQTVVAGEDAHPKLDPAVRLALDQATTASTVRVIVKAEDGKFADMRSRVLGKGNGVSAEHQFIGAVTAQLKKADIASLEAESSVAHISLDHVVRSTAAPAAGGPPGGSPPGGGPPGGGPPGGGPPGSANKPIDECLLTTLGLSDSSLTGRGVGVAVLDSGLQTSSDLPAFAFRDFTTDSGGSAYDDYGHGTHISGLIRASASTGNPRAGSGMVGVAPGVRLVSMKVLDGAGQGYTSTVLSALEDVLNNRGNFGIDVVNLSLGHPITEPAATDPLVQAVEALSSQGLVTVAAAGNWGRNPTTGLAAYTGITSPGNAPSAVTVGALDTNQTVVRSDDQVPSYSSRGPTWYDGLVKPDVVAPGDNLPSLAAIGSSLYTRFPDQRVADANGNVRFLRLSGTSMATAVTTGVVALMIEQRRGGSRPPLTANDVKAILQFTAIPVAGSDVFTQGAGAVNAAGALAVVAALTADKNTEWRSTTTVPPTTTIGAETNIWNQAVVWGHTLVAGDTVYANEPAWGSQITWGSAVVWGHGVMPGGDLVWDQTSIWSTNTIWNPIVGPPTAGLTWPELGGQAVVWGHGGPY